MLAVAAYTIGTGILALAWWHLSGLMPPMYFSVFLGLVAGLIGAEVFADRVVRHRQFGAVGLLALRIGFATTTGLLVFAFTRFVFPGE